MTSKQIREAFFKFFREKSHHLVNSAPIVIKDDPSLMFTNAGMNQFKDYFLGNQKPKHSRVVDSQKCLRVSGKHNDLEEVGVDTYHHTMFEMLGNWSFGDFFKAEMIPWAWEFLTEVVQLDPNRLYVTVFQGDDFDELAEDKESYEVWSKILPPERILKAGKKDNFWEMGEVGPCGPCSEIHIDLRTEKQRQKVDGSRLVNGDHPLVVEIWNLVFMQFNRLKDKSLKKLPALHVDTGMGFERLCMAIQGKTSNYDTDLFLPLIHFLEGVCQKKYTAGKSSKDIAFRVIVDHIRAISFSIADGQLPSNNGAAYVIRRILRRAVRYGYSFLDLKSPFLYRLHQPLIEILGESFPELIQQKELIEKVVHEEELSFLATLEKGIQRFESYRKEGHQKVDGEFAFELYDTFGFPPDLTSLLAQENEMQMDQAGFNRKLEEQKSRSRIDAKVNKGDWVSVHPDEKEEFIGYNQLQSTVKVSRFRELDQKGKKRFHLVFNLTPFYPEGGGQVGDRGVLKADDKQYRVLDTFKENQLIIHLMEELPQPIEGEFQAEVNLKKRKQASAHHSATHLLHYSLRKILGEHVTQKGSLVSPDYLRFDFSHFQKLSPDELRKIEVMVNDLIRSNISCKEERNIARVDAEKKGALALFGEKYGDTVRVISFGESVELCGGTHVQNSGEIGFFKITSEGSVASGIRRIEAVCSEAAQKLMFEQHELIEELKQKLKQPGQILQAVGQLQKEQQQLQKELERWKQKAAGNVKQELLKKLKQGEDFSYLIEEVSLDVKSAKSLIFQLKKELDRSFILLASKASGKAGINISIDENLAEEKGWNAAEMIKVLAQPIEGGGGGKAFFATAGGQKPEGIPEVLKLAVELIKE